MTDIPALEQRVSRLRIELDGAQAELDAAYEAAAPFHVGDVVEARDGSVWREAIVRVVDARSQTWVWYRVSFPKKDGEWSKVGRHAFDVRRKGS